MALGCQQGEGVRPGESGDQRHWIEAGGVRIREKG